LAARRLSRRTSSGAFIPEIDGARFVAVVMVVLMHITLYCGSAYLAARGSMVHSNPLWRAAQAGGYGVQLFFVISGFVLSLPFLASRHEEADPLNLRWYYLRRLTRLEPPYIVSLVLFALVVAALPAPHEPVPPHLVAGLFYMHGQVFGTANTINPGLWSLEVEVQFYLLMPLLAGMFAISATRLRRSVFVALAAAAVIAQTVLFPGQARLSLSVLGQIQYFLVGFLIADIYIVDWKREPAREARWDWASVIGVVLSALAILTGWLWLLPLAFVPLFLGVFRGRRTSAALRIRWVFTIGGMVYSIYLIHPLVIRLLWRFPRVFVPWRSFALDLAFDLVMIGLLILAASTAFFLAVERPCMNPDLVRRLFGVERRRKGS